MVIEHDVGHMDRSSRLTEIESIKRRGENIIVITELKLKN